MKKILFFEMGVAIAMTSCESGITEEVATSAKTAKVHVNLSGFEIETMTRATTANDAGVSGIAFAVIDSKGEIVDSAQQKPKDEDFGSVSFELTEGTYTFAAEAHVYSDVSSISVSGGKAIATINGNAVYETFTASEQVEVKAGENMNLEMVLSRISALLYLETKDKQPAGAKKLQFFIGDTTKSSYNSFSIDLATGTMAGFGTTGHLAREWTRGTSNDGKPTTQDCSLLLADKEQSLPVTIVVRDANDDVLYSRSIASVPFKQNSKTIITGELYSAKGDYTFQFDTDWAEDTDGGW